MRHYTNFYLIADSTANSHLLANARQAINDIKDAQDTLNGVHIILQDATPYRDFIKAAEIFSEKKPRAFAPYNNHIYAVYISPSFHLTPPGQQHNKVLSFY